MSLAAKVTEWIKQRFPIAYFYASILPQSYLHRRRHVVNNLLKGRLATGTKKSCLFFSVHKSATSFFSDYLKTFANACHLTYVDYNGYFFAMGAASLSQQRDPSFLNQVFHPHNYLYGPLRYFLPISDLEQYRIVLFLRDPRDVLTSHYFSVKNTHPLNTPRMIRRRAIARNSTIDEFVYANADRFLKTYTEYCTYLLPHNNVLFLRYEEMIVDFKHFITKLSEHIEVNLSEAQIAMLDRSSEFVNHTENPLGHKRKVTAGDYKEKLQPETIKWINDKFRDVLKQLEYT